MSRLQAQIAKNRADKAKAEDERTLLMARVLVLQDAVNKENLTNGELKDFEHAQSRYEVLLNSLPPLSSNSTTS